VFLDEGVPIAVGQTFAEHGHEVIYLKDAIQRGSPDTLVSATAQANNAILVAFDSDMKQIARDHGVSNSRFVKLSLIKFSCSEPMAVKRLTLAMSLIEHEWRLDQENNKRRIFIEIGKSYIRTHR
jgi:predicted nuclease of predicted toxin-antitoxin system